MNRRLFWSIFRYIFSLAMLLVVSALIFVWWAVGGSLPTRSLLTLDTVKDAQVWEAPENLVVVSYNIGHGQGVKEQAWDYRDKETTLKQLSLLADAMVKMNADIFLLQEVDLDSHRTFRINQIDYLKQKTKHPYHACANVWEKNYLPFPYWPPAHHLGYIRSANCILSRFPLSNHERIIFDKPKSNSFWYNLGYIDRGIERVDVDVGGKKVAVLNLHLEAWDIAAREEQIKLTNNYINEINMPTILGGDFNTVMPDAVKQTGFADEPDVDYSKESTMQWFLSNAKNLKTPTLSTRELYTFPSDNPDRRLDFIYLLGPSLWFVDFRVVAEAALASDHLPVMATIRYRD